MTDKIIFGYSDFDEENLTQPIPNGYSNIEMYIRKVIENIDRNSMFKNNNINRFYDSNLFSFKDINNIKNDERYIYPIKVSSIEKKQDNGVYYTIPEKVLNDIKEKRCVILFERLWEGDMIGHIVLNRKIFNNTNIDNFREDLVGKLLHSDYKDIPYSSIFFINSNLNIKEIKSSYSTFSFNFFESLSDEINPDEINEIKNNILNKQIREYKFCCLNRTNRDHRVHLAYLLFDLVHNTDLVYTFNVFSGSEISGIENTLLNNIKIKDKNKVSLMLKSLPWAYDLIREGETNDLSTKSDIYKKAYINITTETYFDIANIMFFTEKTFKPIKMLQPFILVSTPYSLKKLREIGYETFPEIIDESYDEIEDSKERLETIAKEVRRLYSKSKEELTDMLYSVIDKLEHNSKLLSKQKENASLNFYNTLQKEIYNNWPK